MPARLHHERISHSESQPARWLLLTHGIYGAGSNWRGIARKIVDRRRDWGVELVDLRAHGRSDTGEPPHTIETCATDVCALVDEMRAEGRAVRALAGHSFGSKVMLATRSRIEVDQTWMLDGNPGPRPGAFEDDQDSVVRVLRTLEALPRTWATREAFVGAIEGAGFATSLAQWLAMSLQPGAGGPLVNRLDPAVLRELLASYFVTDLWSAAADASRGALEIVIATESSVWTTPDRARLAELGSHVRAHDVTAGHWLHVEAPGPVVDDFVTELPS